MTGSYDDLENADVSPQEEPAPTPLFSSASFPLEKHRVIDLPENRRKPIEWGSKEIAKTWAGSVRNHTLGKFGEDAVLQYAGKERHLNLSVIPDGGDGGVDIRINGAKVQVKTVSQRHAEQPELWVDAHRPCSADYYVLVSRIGPGSFRLIGYVPRWFVWNAPKRTHSGDTYRVVDREYLFPIPRIDPANL